MGRKGELRRRSRRGGLREQVAGKGKGNQNEKDHGVKRVEGGKEKAGGGGAKEGTMDQQNLDFVPR